MKGRTEWDTQTTTNEAPGRILRHDVSLHGGSRGPADDDKGTAGAATGIATAADRFKGDLDKASTSRSLTGTPPRRKPSC